METIELHGKRYLKASSAARETGYTMDYIGQLCRKNKIDSELVGRTWYVLESEIHEHRRTRGRTHRTKVREAVQKEIEVARKGILNQRPQAHASRVPQRQLYTHEVRYHSENADVMPNLREKHLTVLSRDKEVTVHTNGESSVAVKADSHVEKLNPTRVKTEEVKWNGTIVVSPLAAEEEKDEEIKEAHIAAVADKHTTKVTIHYDKEAELPQKLQVEDTTQEESTPEEQFREPTQAFMDRLNHAHVLNAAVEEAENNQEEEPKPRGYVVHPRIATTEGSNVPTVLSLTVAVSAVIVMLNVFVGNTASFERNGSKVPAFITKYEL